MRIWIVVAVLSLFVLATRDAAAEGPASAEPGAGVCHAARRVAPELVAALLGDAQRDVRHRFNPLWVVRAAERRIEQSERLRDLLGACPSDGLDRAELRWLEAVVAEAAETSPVGRNASLGVELRLLRDQIREALAREPALIYVRRDGS